MHDLLVHPALQGCGLGGVLLRRLLGQVATGGVHDVGLVTPAHLQPFFTSCAFELDREDSTPMALHVAAGCTLDDAAAASAAHLRADGLRALLERAIDAGGVPRSGPQPSAAAAAQPTGHAHGRL